jgi:hypothetical protein
MARPGVTRDIYFPSRPLSGLGTVYPTVGVAAPMGAVSPTPPGWSDMFGNFAQMLGLVELGIYTPWAARESTMDWEPVQQPPDTNIAVWSLTDEGLRNGMQLAGGAPLSFVGILTNELPALEEVAAKLRGTPYRFYQTQAVYSQVDTGEPPVIRFLHWAIIRESGDSDKGASSMDVAAVSLGGKLVFAMQVPYGDTSRRNPPATDFDTALIGQIGEPPPIEVIPVPGTPGAPAAPGTPGARAAAGVPWAYVAGAGLVAAAAGFVITKQVRAKRGSR